MNNDVYKYLLHKLAHYTFKINQRKLRRSTKNNEHDGLWSLRIMTMLSMHAGTFAKPLLDTQSCYGENDPD